MNVNDFDLKKTALLFLDILHAGGDGRA